MRTIILTSAIISCCSFSLSAKVTKLTVTSPAFANNGAIPVKYTCLGQSASPPINVANIPATARSLAIVICDPDATSRISTVAESYNNTTKGKKTTHKKTVHTRPAKMMDACTPDGFTHWVIWNIDTGMSIPENFRNDDIGMNSAKQQGYVAMCPPAGMHHYIFKVYALDTKMKLDKSTDRAGLERAMKDHIVGEGVLTGTYDKTYQ